MKIELTVDQAELIEKIALLAIKNGNCVVQEEFSPTPEEYKKLHCIVNAITKAKNFQ